MENKLYSLRNGFKTARRRKGFTQQDVADKMGVILKTVMNWEQGISNPDLETTIKLAELFECDVDFLIGRMKEHTHDIKTACELTGLSESAIEKIRDPKLNHPFAKTLSKIIESEQFYNLMTTYKIFLVSAEKLRSSNIDEPPFELNDEDKVVLNRNEATHHFMRNVATAMTHICEEEYYKQLDIASKRTQHERLDALDSRIKAIREKKQRKE